MGWSSGGPAGVSVSDSTPTTSAVGDAASAGSSGDAARADHTHGREGFGSPGSSGIGDGTSAGSAASIARSDHRHGREGSGTPVTQAHSDSASAGGASTLARSDHRHGMPASSGVTSGTIAFFTGACPSGWTEYTTARGRYIVGTPSGGTAQGTAGTALTNTENRAVGSHQHGPSSASNRVGSNCMNYWVWNANNDGSKSTAVAGTVAGTNAPYVQLTVCKKD